MDYIGISLQEYLIKYSQVDRQFIRDFIHIQESNKNGKHYPFIVDFDLVVKWLDTDRSEHLRRTLFRSYVKGIDYLLPPMWKQDKSGHGGYNRIYIL